MLHSHTKAFANKLYIGDARACTTQLRRPALEADALLVDPLLDVCDGLARVEAFGTRLGAVHDGHAPVQLHTRYTEGGGDKI